MFATSNDPTLTIRAATGADAVALEDLARLDSQRPLMGAALVAEQDGRLLAALSGERVVADPFRQTSDLVALLRLRAAGTPNPAGARIALPRVLRTA